MKQIINELWVLLLNCLREPGPLGLLVPKLVELFLRFRIILLPSSTLPIMLFFQWLAMSSFVPELCVSPTVPYDYERKIITSYIQDHDNIPSFLKQIYSDVHFNLQVDLFRTLFSH